MKFLFIQLALAIPSLLLQAGGVAFFFDITLTAAAIWVSGFAIGGFLIGYFYNRWLTYQINEQAEWMLGKLRGF
jgi:hypothetical protein